MHEGPQHAGVIVSLPCGVGWRCGCDSSGLGRLRQPLSGRQAEHHGHLPRGKPAPAAVHLAANVSGLVVNGGTGRIQYHKRHSHPPLHSDGQEILAMEAQMQVPSARRPGSRAYISETIGLAGITFAQAGDYAFHILIGDDEKAVVPLHVNEPTTGD